MRLIGYVFKNSFFGGGDLLTDPLIQPKTNKLYMMLILKRVDAALHIVIRLPSPLIIAHFMSIVQTKAIWFS